MKWAYPYATPETRLPILGFRGSPDEVFSDLKRLGYDGIEAFVRNPGEIDIALLERQLSRCGLQMAAVGTGPVVSEDKLTFAAESAEARKAAVWRALQIVEFASHFGAPVAIGKLRGDINEGQPERSMGWIREALEQVCARADKRGIQVLLEPQNKSVINNLNGTRETVRFIRDLQIPNLKLMLDIYHMDTEDGSTVKGFAEGKGLLRYIHAADHDRLPPGQGGMDFGFIMRELHAADYTGYITPEIVQKPDSFTAAKLSVDFLRSLVPA
ncbi:sugar phosphate isomerase/epimerase family protein [Paenibacillus hamazuiensis]|uniref:sugar phosphate isomerase/epimerase family protein n=1 Tax=Paenibacillus hamazuiensis TaxID=2936508 RepID=UPI00200FA5E1